MIHKILIGADGSECAVMASRLGAMIARHFGAQVAAVNVFNPASFATPLMGVWTIAVDQNIIEDCAQGQVRVIEREMIPLFIGSNLSCPVIQEMGHPVGGIVRVAEREKADMVVVGSRGLSGIKELFLGSVSNGVLHHAPCPVLIAVVNVSPTLPRASATSCLPPMAQKGRNRRWKSPFSLRRSSPLP